MFNPLSHPYARLEARRPRNLAVMAAVAGLALAPSLFAGEIVTVRTHADRVASTEATRDARTLSDAFRTVAERVRPSVVQILAIDDPPYADNAGRGLQRDQIPERFRDMIPGRPAPEAPRARGPRTGQGTGVIATEGGMIVTNNHVIAGADRVRVVLYDGSEVDGTVIGADPETDLAIVKIDRDDLQPAIFADSDEVQVGDWVVALGSPYGLSQTVTAGIISALGREAVGLARFENYMQTDAAINPGNSGGPLVNLDGDVIGINTAISSRGGGNDGIGFAIPSRMVERIANDLAGDGTVERGWLGVNIQSMDDPDLAASFGRAARRGVLVSGVLDGTPAAEAGLTPGDIILSIDGQRTNTPASLARTVAEYAPEAEIELEFVRDGRSMTLTATLGTRPGDASQRSTDPVEPEIAAPPRLGLELAPLDAELREQAGLTAETGIFVRGVAADGPAARAGIEPGDAILRLGGIRTESVKDFKNALAEIPEDQPVRLLIERQGTTRFLLVKSTD
jgi:serine protease Do